MNALRAIELDDSLAEAHNSLGLVKLFRDWDWEGAEASFRRALEIEPSYWWARSTYSMLLALTGRLDEALAEMERTYELDPLNPVVVVALADLHAWRGEPEQARMWWEKALELDPSYPVHHQSLVTGLCREGQVDETTIQKGCKVSNVKPLVAIALNASCSMRK